MVEKKSRRKKKPSKSGKYHGKFGVSSTGNGRLKITLPRCTGAKPGAAFCPGLPDTPEGWIQARAIAAQAERDFLLQVFDPTLEKYRIRPSGYKPLATTSCISEADPISLTGIHEEYIEIHQDAVRPSTFANGYLTNLSHVKSSPFAETNVNQTDDISYAQKLADWCRKNLTKDTSRRLMQHLNKVFKWAIAVKKIPLEQSPFQGLDKQFKSHHKRSGSRKTPQYFTSEMRDAILDQLLKTSQGRHYYPYTVFRFLTGARCGEIIALTVGDIDSNFEKVTFNKVFSRVNGGLIKVNGLKSEEMRDFPINHQLREVLKLQLEQRPTNKSSLLFTSVKGSPVNSSGYYRDKVWKPTLEVLGIDYLPPYHTRHTFITLCLQSGMTVQEVAHLVGNTPQVIFDNYAGVSENLTVPIL